MAKGIGNGSGPYIKNGQNVGGLGNKPIPQTDTEGPNVKREREMRESKLKQMADKSPPKNDGPKNPPTPPSKDI